jgi:tetratricopeptide (TPR) repeat protein
VTPGSRPWVVRSLRDWARGVRQGMALVTYRSSASREQVLRDLTLELQAEKWKAERLECGDCTAEEFVARIARSAADVLFVLDADRLLFGENGDRSPFWVNFHRETLVAHAGVQIWWMLPNAAIRFGKQLPDLSRFFLLREELKEERAVEREPSLEFQISPDYRTPGDPNRARDLLQRALRAAASPDADPARVWLQLGIPAIDEFLRSGQSNEGLEALRQLTGAAGAPDEVLSPGLFTSAPGDLGTAFLTLSRLYSEVGRRDDALAAAEAAVRVYRELESTSGGTFRSEFGKSLSTLAVELREVGRREDALVRAEEAVHIYRDLARKSPDAFAPDLAASLNTLGAILRDAGRLEDALERAEEAVHIYRNLAHQRPEAFLPGLASSLTTLTPALGSLGRHEEAFARAEEAVQIYGELARQRPDSFLPGLAVSLNNLAIGLGNIGRLEDAVVRAEEAVHTYRQLAQKHPDSFLHDLALSLSTLSAGLGMLGRNEEALARGEEAVRIHRELAQLQPDAFLPALSGSLHNLANTLSQLGREDEAVKHAREAVHIRRQLARKLPDAFLPALGMSVNGLAYMLSDLGNSQEALGSAEEAVHIYRQLAQEQPDAFLPELARSLSVLGRILTQDRPREAMASFEEGIRILAPSVSELPYASAPLVRAILADYLQAAQAAGVEPDMALLGPVNAILEKLGKR